MPTSASSHQEETKKPDQEEEGRDRESVFSGMEEEDIGGEPKQADKICNGGEAAKGIDDEKVEEVQGKERDQNRPSLKSSQKDGNARKEKRGAKREHITLGGLKKVEKATKRKERQKLNRKMGSLPSVGNKNKECPFLRQHRRRCIGEENAGG